MKTTVNLGDALCQTALVVALDVVLCAGAGLVWRLLVGMRVNGPCQLGLALLVLAQLVSDATAIAQCDEALLNWPWLLHTVFCFVFLYMLYHVGVLISAFRS